MTRCREFALIAAALALLGAGCRTPATSTPAAQPFTQDPSQIEAPHTNGFGKLPAISLAGNRGTLRLSAQVPATPPNITVLRLRAGFPNQTEMQHIGSALHIPGGVIGNRPQTTVMDLEWTDDDGAHWIYHPEDRSLEFAYQNIPTQPLTTFTLPSNEAIIRLSDDFLKTRGIQLSAFRDGLVDPDWNLWWFKSKDADRCPDLASLIAIRSIGASVPLTDPGPPVLPSATTTHCLSPEFPAHLTVRYHALVDNQDVVQTNGKYVNGAEIVVDVVHQTIIAGRLFLATNPERSDYPAITTAQVTDRLMKGGTSGISGNVDIKGYEIVLTRMKSFEGDVPASFLVPSLLAHGIKTNADGSQEQTSIVVPLLAQ